MFHVELRRHLEHACRFNMSEQALLTTILMPWAAGKPVDLGERTWRPDETTITVLEGPEIPIGGLTMSRGWPTAIREGRDVTETVVASVRQSLAAKASAAARASGDGNADGLATPEATPGVGFAPGAEAGAVPGGVALPGAVPSGANAGANHVLADAFGLELLRNLGDGPLALNAAWRLAGERHPELQGSGSLELAMNAVSSLLSSGLARLEQAQTGQALDLDGEELEGCVRRMDGWLAESGPEALRIARV
ncbi:MAG TPA: hypothetical protein VGF95_08985 [Solirubrobacteraceae bacterium]|jgi:hypothetical protein